MSRFEYQRETKNDATRIADLDAHSRLGRAFPFWTAGLVPEAKMVGGVVEAMVRIEDKHSHSLSFSKVWSLRQERAGWMDGNIAFDITDEMRDSVANAHGTEEFPNETLDDLVLLPTPPYSEVLEQWLMQSTGDTL